MGPTLEGQNDGGAGSEEPTPPRVAQDLPRAAAWLEPWPA